MKSYGVVDRDHLISGRELIESYKVLFFPGASFDGDAGGETRCVSLVWAADPPQAVRRDRGTDSRRREAEARSGRGRAPQQTGQRARGARDPVPGRSHLARAHAAEVEGAAREGQGEQIGRAAGRGRDE